jgi:DNA-binding MarR family transcriptional regulator
MKANSISQLLNLKDHLPYSQLAHINLLYTASWVNRQINAILKPYGITHEQFNVLRIVNGAAPELLSISRISSRMIDKQSNVSRIIDKLHQKKFVTKLKQPEDKRQAVVFITPAGKQFISTLKSEIQSELNQILDLNDQEAQFLTELLDKSRKYCDN